jgi:hypothetical protein
LVPNACICSFFSFGSIDGLRRDLESWCGWARCFESAIRSGSKPHIAEDFAAHAWISSQSGRDDVSSIFIESEQRRATYYLHHDSPGLSRDIEREIQGLHAVGIDCRLDRSLIGGNITVELREERSLTRLALSAFTWLVQLAR